MRKILIISPHYPPSNLAAVHRSRLFAQHLPFYGWDPVILTVHEKFYEEQPDWHLHQLIPTDQRIEKTGAYRVTKPRLIGDIGLRAFFQLRKKALQLIQNEKFDFVYIPIPSFYIAIIGSYLHRKTGIRYGIDYIDPWVHQFPGSDKMFSRHWWSTKLAKYLEPRAVKNCSLITGVATGYYQPVLERNPDLLTNVITGSMPYGGEASDHLKIKELNIEPYLFQKKSTLKFVYAGAMLPKAYKPLEQIFKTISANDLVFENIEFHFIGTGSRANDAESFNIRPLAEKYNLWNRIVFEYPQRIPYLDVLVHLAIADAVFILGSTEPHYTPSKTYQAVLSSKPILAILHSDSTAVSVLKNSNAGIVLDFNGEEDLNKISENFMTVFREFNSFKNQYSIAQVDMSYFEQFSAKAVTGLLANLLNKVIA